MLSRRLVLALAGLLLAPALAAAQPAAPPPAPPAPPMFDSADADAVRATVNRYFALFTAKDYAAFGSVFTAPFVMAGRQIQILPDLAAVSSQYRGIRDRLDNDDYSASRVAEMRVQPLSGRMALAPLHWERLRKNGERLSEGAEAYVLAKIDGQWRITGVLPYDLRQFKAGD